jgi:nucleotide-binding universal stress UspA family protein
MRTAPAEKTMQELRSILVGLDVVPNGQALTAGSRGAAEQALRLARRTGARVDFLHSRHAHDEDGGHRERPGPGVSAELERLRAEHGDGVVVSELLLDDERPWIALTRRILAGENDLVVVAKRNQQRSDDRRLGSVSARIVRKCPGPVWVVKPDHPLRHRSVLAATDLTPVGDLATEYGAFLARADECELAIVHAWQVPLELQLSAARIGDEETAQRKRAIADAARRHVRAVPAVAELGDAAKVYLTCDSPSHAILQLAAEKDPDLVVMGTISRGGIAGMLIGNTAERLLYQLDCSILTVKPANFVSPLAG